MDWQFVCIQKLLCSGTNLQPLANLKGHKADGNNMVHHYLF